MTDRKTARKVLDLLLEAHPEASNVNHRASQPARFIRKSAPLQSAGGRWSEAEVTHSSKFSRGTR